MAVYFVCYIYALNTSYREITYLYFFFFVQTDSVLHFEYCILRNHASGMNIHVTVNMNRDNNIVHNNIIHIFQDYNANDRDDNNYENGIIH